MQTSAEICFSLRSCLGDKTIFVMSVQHLESNYQHIYENIDILYYNSSDEIHIILSKILILIRF